MVIAHMPGQNNTLLGQFIPQNANQQTLNCSGLNPEATIAHNNPSRTNFQSMQFMWQAPADANGTVDFRYAERSRKLTLLMRRYLPLFVNFYSDCRFTVVQQFNTFFVAQSAAQVSI